MTAPCLPPADRAPRSVRAVAEAVEVVEADVAAVVERVPLRARVQVRALLKLRRRVRPRPAQAKPLRKSWPKVVRAAEGAVEVVGSGDLVALAEAPRLIPARNPSPSL